MTRTIIRLVAIAVAALAVAPGRSAAQPPTPGFSRPVFSPYLNLARRDSSAGANYYGLVRPQIATQNALQSIQQQVTAVQSSVQPSAGRSADGTELPVTGQVVSFLNAGGYFLNNRVGSAQGAPVTSRPLVKPITPERPRSRSY